MEALTKDEEPSREVAQESIDASGLPLLAESELARSANATWASFPHAKLIHELIEEQVQLTPHAIAVLCQGQSLTYDLLNREANQLARHLRLRGVRPEQPVALCFERSIDMLVAVLGTLKAGGAYVPLDPTNPPDRLRYMLSDSKPRVVLTHEAFRGVFSDSGLEIVDLERNRRELSQHDDGNLDPRLLGMSSRNLAYIIYTSGSTGTPKGVGIEHRSLVNYAVYALRQFEVAAGSGSLICSSISFDLMLTGLYPTLLSGRTVRLCAERHGVPDLEEELLRCRRLSLLKITPSHAGLLERALINGELEGRVRVLVFGGERLPPELVRRWRTHSPQTRIYNHYGPTEATVGCVVNEICADPQGPVPIGKPISNTQIHILDQELHPVRVGDSGDIYVGGAGVARGYRGRSSLTAERFIADPFSMEPGARLYRTGDVGRWCSGGLIEYLGRRDEQVKVRGFRVELAEIEAHLVRHAQVRQAAVVCCMDLSGETSLTAYVVADRGTSALKLIAQLSDYLSALLPPYMLPSSWKILPRLPLTPNGKVDRRALSVLQELP